jgi:hypothetical protein
VYPILLLIDFLLSIPSVSGMLQLDCHRDELSKAFETHVQLTTDTVMHAPAGGCLYLQQCAHEGEHQGCIATSLQVRRSFILEICSVIDVSH